MKLKPHEFALLAPPASPADYNALKREIVAVKKIREPAMIFEGKILDGRTRNEIAEETGFKLSTEKFKGTRAEALQYVHSKLLRRNLTESQKAATAVQFLPHYEKLAASRLKTAASGTGAQGDFNGRARDHVGDMFGVSGRYVGYAKVLKENSPKLFNEVLSGKLLITRATSLLDREKRTAHVKKVSAAMTFSPDDFKFIVGDAIVKMPELPRGKARLVFFDPPYNLGFKYDGDKTRDRRSTGDYLRFIESMMEELIELLTPDGALCVMICEEWVDAFGLLLRSLGLTIRRLIVWHETFGETGNRNFGKTCRFIWYAVKDPKNFVFDKSAMRVESKRATTYNDKRAMPGGKVPDALWDFSRLCGTFKERIKDPGIPTQLPQALVERLIGILTDPGDLVIDPCCGTGTTIRAAAALQRKCITIDQSKKYIGIAKRELSLMAIKGKG